MYSWLYSVADKEEGEREGEGGDGETPQRLQHIQGSGQVLKLHLRERETKVDHKLVVTGTLLGV